jgi:hypothetical protein
VTNGYKISKVNTEGQCESERSVCVETTTTGLCTAAPAFFGITAVASSGASNCGNDIQWNDASGYCSNDIKYDVFKSLDPTFLPNSNNKVATNLSGNNWHDILVEDESEYYYLVRATDDSNQSQDKNVVKLSSVTHGQLNNGNWTTGAEIGDNGFNQATRHVGWEVNVDQFHSGLRSYWGQNQSNTCNDLTTQSIQLTAGETSQLSFWTSFDIENEWDGGVVEISNDSTTWSPLGLNYPGQFRDSSDACGYAQGTPSFTGSSGWQQHTVDLSAYQGQDIKVRWNYSTDGAVNNQGWFVDDISITNTQVPSQCNALSDEIYISGFDN